MLAIVKEKEIVTSMAEAAINPDPLTMGLLPKLPGIGVDYYNQSITFSLTYFSNRKSINDKY